MQLLAPALDLPRIRHIAEHVLEFGPVGILQAESACNLARADFARLFADEGEQLFPGGEARFGHGAFHAIWIREGVLACLLASHRQPVCQPLAWGIWLYGPFSP